MSKHALAKSTTKNVVNSMLLHALTLLLNLRLPGQQYNCVPLIASKWRHRVVMWYVIMPFHSRP
jgi:hypothetical protein